MKKEKSRIFSKVSPKITERCCSLSNMTEFCALSLRRLHFFPWIYDPRTAALLAFGEGFLPGSDRALN